MYLQYISTYNSLIEDADLWVWQLLWQLAFLLGDFGGVRNLAAGDVSGGIMSGSGVISGVISVLEGVVVNVVENFLRVLSFNVPISYL
jgi:hypothetical protein